MAAPRPWFRMPAPPPPTLRPAIPIRPPPPPPPSSPNPQINPSISSSPKTANSTSHNHPSPLQLPSPQIKLPSHQEPKIQQKSILLQDEKPTRTASKAKKLSDSEDLGMRVITIAGDNKGALMEISSPSAKGYTLSNTNQLQQRHQEDKDKETTFLNSNVQGVNNSIVCNSTCHHNDPGIHLSLNHNGAGRAHHG